MATYTVDTVSGVVTSWLPLTASFSAPSACFTGIYSQQGSAGQLIAFDPFYQSIVPSFSTACFPEQATLWYNQGADPLSTVTSLGPFECPGGYTTAFTTEQAPSSTEIACCPSGYVYQGSFVDHGTVGECWSTPKSGATLNYFTLTDSGPWSETSTVLGSTHVVGVQINGWNIAPLSTSSPSSSSTNPTGSSSGSISPSSSGSSSSSSSSSSGLSGSSVPNTGTSQSALPGSASTSSSSSSTNLPVSNAGTTSSGMSTGSKAALGVGVTLAILGVVALVFAFFLIRRHRRGQIAPPVDGTAFWGGQVHNPKEIDGTERRLGETTQPNGPYYEMSGNYRPA